MVKVTENSPLSRKRTQARVIFLSILFALFGANSAAAAEIYHFQDNDGESFYTNVPAAGRTKISLPLIGERKCKAKVNKAVDFHLKEAYEPVIASASRHFAVDPDIVRAVIKAESNYDVHAVSAKGAMGLMQLMPATAREMGVRDIFDPAQNILGGVRYLRGLLDALNGDLPLALAAYNAGPSRVSKEKRVPPVRETLSYVGKVLNFYKNLKGMDTT